VIPAHEPEREPEDGLDPGTIARAAAGEPAAARALVARCHPLVRRIVRAHRARDVADEDLIQDVFARMFAELHRYEVRAGSTFEHWLARLATNVCRDALRTEARRADAIPIRRAAEGWLEFLVAERAAPPEDAVAARELVDALLAQLPPDDRLVLTLVDLERRSTAEVAALTGWSRALVKVRAFRARIRLRAAAKRLGGRDG
jgi:RNA polymerase sigma-70 factor (ECF subfamily)